MTPSRSTARVCSHGAEPDPRSTPADERTLLARIEPLPASRVAPPLAAGTAVVLGIAVVAGTG